MLLISPTSWPTETRMASKIPLVENIQRAGNAARCFQVHLLAQRITQRDGVGWIEHADAITQAQFLGNLATGDHTGGRAAASS